MPQASRRRKHETQAASVWKGFQVIFGNRRAQAAQMVISPGGSEGDARNRHRSADQWLYVASGTGRALINGKRVNLRPGLLLLIEHGDRHQIMNTGRSSLRTLNFYTPPAYTAGGEELPAARPS